MSTGRTRTAWHKPHAKVITIGKAFVDRLTEIEITLHTDEMQLHLIVYRVREAPLARRGFTLATDELGPFESVGKLREDLHSLFGESTAQKNGAAKQRNLRSEHGDDRNHSGSH